MDSVNLDFPHRVVASQAAVAALSAIGLATLLEPAGGRDQTVLVATLITALLVVAFVIRRRDDVAVAGPAQSGSSTIDPLTGVATAGAGDQVLGLEFAAAQRGRPLTVVLLRIEQLPRYRTRHGRVVANQLLRVTGRVLRRHRRGMHLVARRAGEDGVFLCILSESGLEGATVFATRVRRELLRPPGLPAHAGISVGIASFDMSMRSPQDLLRQASIALGRAAASGGKVAVMGSGGDAARA